MEFVIIVIIVCVVLGYASAAMEQAKRNKEQNQIEMQKLNYRNKIDQLEKNMLPIYETVQRSLPNIEREYRAALDGSDKRLAYKLGHKYYLYKQITECEGWLREVRTIKSYLSFDDVQKYLDEVRVAFDSNQISNLYFSNMRGLDKLNEEIQSMNVRN